MQIKIEDLRLKVSPSYSPDLFKLSKYDDFLDRLCWTREYQKEAIKNTCVYLLGWRYKNLLELAKENYENNPILREKYTKFSDFEKKIHLWNKLACNIDLATWTWKSYVIYWIAQIMLCEWKIDKVLVLCPSLTIEEWLIWKFRFLSSDKELCDTLPKDSNYRNPKIIQATQTIEEWCICIENIHATYKNTNSAIDDSLFWRWERTLILNDEAHHIYSKVNSDLKKWYEFISNEAFWFKYIVWFTGTPYIDNEYFPDIIYRYGILEWMEDKFIKKVDYIKDTDKRLDSTTRMQLVLHNHEEARRIYNRVKPITIFISKDIKHCEKDREYLINTLLKEQWWKREDIEKKVLIVTSDEKHKKNLDILKTVWDKNNPVEWICSVAMLTEWWDVPNVFQIVPSEERAFDSKLLISQVIWRWLRVPQEYKNEDISVIVLNHEKFKDNISHLVDEILEREDKIYSYPVNAEEKIKYAFPIYNLEYDEEQIEEAKTTDYKAPNFRDWFNLFSDDDEEDINITYWTIWTDNEEKKLITLKKETKTIDELTNEIYNKIQAWCIELENDWANEKELEKLNEIDYNQIYEKIKNSLDKKWLDKEKISIENSNKILQWFWVLKRFWSKNIRYNKEPKDVLELDIYDEENWIKKTWVALNSVKVWNAYVYYDEDSFTFSDEDDKQSLEILEDIAWRKYFCEVRNKYLHKTPFNIGIVLSNPENEFYKLLIDESNSDVIDWFFKSKDKWFYDLEYRRIQWTRTPKVWKFNPDFFIKSWNKILVVEIKWNESEKEYSRTFLQNKAKYQQAKKHFEELNKKLKEKWIDQIYYFNFCSPKDFRTLFKYLHNWNINQFTSRIEAAFEESLLKDSLVKEVEFFDDKELKTAFWLKWDNLEMDSKIYILTCEKNYFDNKDNDVYNFSWWELIKAFELELRNKLFDRIRENEELRENIISEEEWREEEKYINKKAIEYFSFTNERLDLWAMEMLLTYNETLVNYFKKEFSDSWFYVWKSFNNIDFDNCDINKIDKKVFKNLPNLIKLIRKKFRNDDFHWGRTVKKEDLEKLREIMIYDEWILVKLQDCFK